MKQLSALILALTAPACLGPPYDADLRGAPSASLPQIPAGAPVFRYELVVVVPGEQARLGGAEAFSDRVAVAVDDLLVRRGVSPQRSAAGADIARVHLTLIHGASRTELWAERDGLRKTYTALANPPRRSLDELLGRMLADFRP